MSVQLTNTVDERNAASQTKSVEHGQQEAPVLRTDSLATSSLIYAALADLKTDGKGDGLTQTEREIIGNMKVMAQRLSKNTLSSWYKGAAIVAGTREEIFKLWGKNFAEQCYNASGEMTPWLRELRRSYGNTWEGCMAAAKFVEEYQNAKLRTEMFSNIPSLSALDDDGTSVKGWDFNRKASNLNSLYDTKGKLPKQEKAD